MLLRSISMTLAPPLPSTGYAKIQAAPAVGCTGLNFTVTGGTSIGNQATCTTLSLDANGDISGTRRLAAYGIFNCGNANQALSVTSSGYLTTAYTVNMNLNVGILLWVCSLNSATFNGTCSVITYNGQGLGTLTLTFVP